MSEETNSKKSHYISGKELIRILVVKDTVG